MKNVLKLIVSGTALAAVGFITGCAPGDSTGKVAGETRLRSAHSSITGFNHNYTENNNSCIDLKISAEVLEAFSGIDPSLFGSGANLLALNPNALGSLSVKDKTLKFQYDGDIVFANLVTFPSDTQGIQSQVQARLGADAGSALTPEFQERLHKSMAPFNKINEIHKGNGVALDGVFIAAGHGRNSLPREEGKEGKEGKPPAPAPVPGDTCGSYFYSLTVQTKTLIPAGSLDSFLNVPIIGSSSPEIPAGSTLQLFVTVGTCGFYEALGISDKAKIKVDLKKVVIP